MFPSSFDSTLDNSNPEDLLSIFILIIGGWGPKHFGQPASRKIVSFRSLRARVHAHKISRWVDPAGSEVSPSSWFWRGRCGFWIFWLWLFGFWIVWIWFLGSWIFWLWLFGFWIFWLWLFGSKFGFWIFWIRTAIEVLRCLLTLVDVLDRRAHTSTSGDVRWRLSSYVDVRRRMLTYVDVRRQTSNVNVRRCK